MARSKIIGAVEIGTSKVVVLIGDVVNGRSLSIIGMGQCSSRGVIKGDIIDFKQASDCTHAAILAAEQQAGASIEGIYLAQAGSHIDGFYNEASVTVSSADNMVSREDISMVSQLAKGKALPPNRSVIHHIRRPFRLDGRTISNPELLEGRRLEVGYWTVHGDVAKISDSIHIINGFTLHVDDLILSSLASGVMVSTETERKGGALVLDIGSGLTDYVLYRDGYVEMTGSLALGGDHITNDLSLGLRVSRTQAESVKLKSASAHVQPTDKTGKIWLTGDLSIGDRQIPQLAINQITSLRVEEIFEVVKAKLGPAYRPDKLAGGVILTGGSSRLGGICEAASKVFGVSARLGEAPGWVKEELRGSEYITALGLLNYGLSGQGEKASGEKRSKGLLAKLFS
jgi:cell division protein FtsA